MATERIVPRREERLLGYSPSIQPAPLVQPSQFMAPPTPKAAPPPETNELFQIADSLKFLNRNLQEFGIAYIQDEDQKAQAEGQADANANPVNAAKALRMGWKEAVAAGLVKESSNPTYWRYFQTKAGENMAQSQYFEFLNSNYGNSFSDPKSVDSIPEQLLKIRQEFLSKNPINSQFGVMAFNNGAQRIEESFSARALEKRLEAREVATREELGISIQRSFREAEGMESEQGNAFVINSFITSVSEAYDSGVSNPTYHAIRQGVMPYIDQLRRTNSDKAMAFVQALKYAKLPNGVMVGEGNTLDLFNKMEEEIIRTERENASKGVAGRGRVLTAGQDKIYELVATYPDLNDAKAEEDIINALLSSSVITTDESGAKEEIPLNGWSHLHGTLRAEAKRIIQEQRSADAQPNQTHMNAFDLAIVNNNLQQAKELYEAGQASGFNGKNQAKMLEAIQTLSNFEPLLKTRSAQEARAIVASTIGNEYKLNQPVASSALGLLDLEFNKAVKESMEEHMVQNPNQTQEQAAPVVMNKVKQVVLERLRSFADKETKSLELADKRRLELESKNAELLDRDKAVAGPSWFNRDDLERVVRERRVISNLIELSRTSRTGLAPEDQLAVAKKLSYIDSKITGLVDRLAAEVNNPYEKRALMFMGQGEGNVTYDVPKSAEKTQSDLVRYYSAKAVQGYTPAEIMAGETDHRVAVDPNLNPLLTPVFSSIEELANFRLALKDNNPTAQKFVDTLKIRDVNQFVEAQGVAIEALGRGKAR